MVKIHKLGLKLIRDLDKSLNYHSQEEVNKSGRASQYGTIDFITKCNNYAKRCVTITAYYSTHVLRLAMRSIVGNL